MRSKAEQRRHLLAHLLWSAVKPVGINASSYLQQLLESFSLLF